MKRNCLWFVYAIAGVVLLVTFSGKALLGAEPVASISVTDFGAKGDGKRLMPKTVHRVMPHGEITARPMLTIKGCRRFVPDEHR